jgi:hypothetical protein
MNIRPLIVLVLACIATACDRRDSSNTAGSSPPPRPAPHVLTQAKRPPSTNALAAERKPAPKVSTDVERTFAYQQKVQPFYSEMFEFVTTADTFNSDGSASRIKALKLDFVDLNSRLTDEDKSHQSYKFLIAAIDEIQMACDSWQENARIQTRLKSRELNDMQSSSAAPDLIAAMHASTDATTHQTQAINNMVKMKLSLNQNQ